MNLLTIITHTGIFIFAITGAFKARAYRMDVFGAAVLAFVTAYGGGTMRDLLINARPYWLSDNIAMILVLISTIITFLFKRDFRQFRKIVFFTDAVGIGLFTVAGIEKSLQAGINNVNAVLLGMITATFGGLLGDLLCNTLPTLMKRGELYATACAIGGIVYIGLKQTSLNDNTNLVICVLIIVGIRIYSKRKRLMLPEI